MDGSLLERIQPLMPRLIEIRKTIHRNPELGFEEYQTAALVAGTLEDLGIEVRTGVANTGVVGVLRGSSVHRVAGGGTRTIALRADMDALPVTELNDVDYASRVPGKMHACGHDVHTTILLGAAMVLAGMRDQLNGNVKFIFQPAEESAGGALPMIEQGVLKDPDVDAIVGGHCWPGMPAGQIGIGEGPVMAAADFVTIRIIGKGGHGALPHLAVDPIAISFQVGTALQQIVSRLRDPLDPVVLSICSIHGGTKSNVIAEEVVMEGTVRSFNPETRERLPGLIEQVLRGVTSAYGGDYALQFNKLYPPTVNDAGIARLVEKAARKALGNEAVTWGIDPTMGAEDFSFFAERVPAASFRIGVADPTGERPAYPLHNPRFDIHESAIPAAVAVFVQTVLDFLGGDRQDGLS